MTLLLLIRHGQTTWNAERRLQGSQDAPLSEKGLEQAQLIAKRLANARIDALYASDLGRATKTAEAINAYHSLPLLTHPSLREINLGTWEGKSVPELEQDETDADLLAKWREDSVANRPPGGERLEELQARVIGVLEQIVESHPEGQVAVVSHGGVIKAAVAWVLGLPLGNQRRFEVGNASITRLELGPNRSHVHSIKDVSHLEQAQKRGRH